jgi:inhibitor of KinA
MPGPDFPRIVPMGDSALVVEFGNEPRPALSSHIAAIASRLRGTPPVGVLDVVPTYTTLAVHYDPALIEEGDSPYDALSGEIEECLRGEPPESAVPGRLVEIPVCYGGRFGEDLEPIAARIGLRTAEVADLHSSGHYHVCMLGFVPGFAYLGGLDPRLATPRRDVPRPRVPAGSVAIGGTSTGIFPLETPGGWHLIGRTPVRLFVAAAQPPCLLNAGDHVRFVPISEEQFEDMAQEVS